MTLLRPQNALFLAEDEAALVLDRKMLRRFGFGQGLFYASGGKALELLRAEAVQAAVAANGPPASAAVDILICNERLADMTGLQFLAHVRNLAGIGDIPALLLVSNEQSAAALAARATNSCAVLARPYSPEQAEEALRAASLPDARHVPMVLPPSFINRFRAPETARDESRPLIRRAKKPVPQDPGEVALREGLAALQRGDVVAADRLLHGSYKADSGRVETCVALSRLYAFLQNEKEEFTWLCRGVGLCLKRGEKTRAAGMLARLPRGKTGQTPLLAEAGDLLQTGEIKAAALMFLEAHRLDPTQPLHGLIGRTCMFTPAPEDHMRRLVKALAGSGHDATASRLERRLLQPPKEEEAEEESFLARFPVLYDIVCVAAHTYKAWRSAA